MFSVLTTCYSCTKEATSRRKEVTFLVLGLDNAGKSTVCACLQNASTEDIAPTVGFVNGHARLKGCNLTLLDLGGGERLREIWHNYYAETHGVVFVMDASDAARIAEAKQALERVIGDKRIKGKPLLIFANKQDGSSALSDQDLSDRLGLEQLFDSAGIDQCQVVACTALRSAISGGKVDRSIRRGAKWLLRCVTNQWDELSERIEADKAAQHEAEAAERRERMERVRRIREERDAAAAEDGDPKGNPRVKQEPGSSSITDVQQTNCRHPTANLELEQTNAPVIVITNASPLHNSSFDSTPALEMGMGTKDSSQGWQQDSPRSSMAIQALEGEGLSSSTSSLTSTPAQAHAVTSTGETLAPRPLQDGHSTDETLQIHTSVHKPLEDADRIVQIPTSAPLEDADGTLQTSMSAPLEDADVETVQGAVTTSLPSQPVASHFLSSASTSSSSSSHASAVRLDPLDLELLKSKKKRKHIGALKQNKVQPAEQVGPQEKPRSGWEEVPRRHSSGIIKLHSSRESLGDSQRTASDGDILVRLPPLPPLVSEVPSVAIQSPGLGDTQFLP